MSSRNIRKLVGNNVLPPPDDDDSDYEPLYSRVTPKRNTYAGLIASSDSESEKEGNQDEEEESPDTVNHHNTTNNKHKTKKKKSKKTKKNIDSSNKLDDVEQSIKEVNELLGALPAPNIEEKPQNPAANIFSVENKHLNVAYELRRVFGPDDEGDGTRRRGRQPNIDRMSKRGLIVNMPEKFQNLPKVGLTMSLQRRENNINYFVYNHSVEYQKVHRRYVENSLYAERETMIVPINYALKMMHVEEIIEGANMMFRIEDYTNAKSLLEQAIAYLQYVSHPSFRLSDPNTRLEYKYMENRVFFVSVLMYLHMLTNSASHRTALELAKMLLNLDPSDPLAMIFIIDTLALRAREHQWLVDVYELWEKERHAEYVFNLQYSNAMANFHVAKKNRLDLSHANSLLQTAIVRFPSVVIKILEVTNTKNERIQTHILYKSGEERTPKYLRDMIYIYAKFSGAKWREPEVMAWLLNNAMMMIDKFESDKEVKAAVLKWNEQRMPMFQGAPGEVIRHLGVIKPMANLLFDEGLPSYIPRSYRAADPQPWPTEDNINRYNYKLLPTSPADVPDASILQFFVAMGPDYRLPHERAQQPAPRLDPALDDNGDDADGNPIQNIFNALQELRENGFDVDQLNDDNQDEWDLQFD